MDTTSLGLDENIEAVLAYLFTFVTGILFYLLEDNEFVRFHAAQSMIVFSGLFIISMVLGIISIVLFPIPGVGQILAGLTGTISFLLTPIGALIWIYLMYRAYRGDRYHAPFAGVYAERYV